MSKKGDFNVSFETKDFQAMLDDFQRNVSAKDLQKFVDFEAGKVLRSAAEKTKQAGAAKLDRDLAAFKRVTNVKGKAWTDKRAQIAEKRRRIGLARQTWLYLARIVGLDTQGGRGLGKVRKATVNGRTIQHEGSARRITKGKTAYAIEVVYRNPVGAFVESASALRSAINGRQGFYLRNLRQGVFKSSKTIAAKYPGIEITPK